MATIHSSIAGIRSFWLFALLSSALLTAASGFGAPAGPSLQEAPPARWINHEYLPAVGSQGDNDVCVLFNRIYYCLTWIKAKEHGWIHPDPAVNPERVMAWEFADFAPYGLQIHGCATYADIASGWNDAGWPTREQWEAALRHRTLGDEQIQVSSAEKLIELKARLARGEIGMTGIAATPVFYQYGSGGPLDGVSNDVYYSHLGQPGVGHAITMIGYDDQKSYVDGNGQPRQGAFLAVNSWGRDWGVTLPEVGTRGFIWLGYDFVRELAMTVEFPINRPEEKPLALAVVEWEHPLSHQISFDLLAGRPQAAQWIVHFNPNKYNRRIKTRIVMDISEPYRQGARSFWLRNYTRDLVTQKDPLQGSIHYFALELPGASEPWVCDQTPARTVPLGSISAPNYLWLSVGLLEDEGALNNEFALGRTRQIWGDFDGDGQAEGIVHGETLRGTDFVYPSYLLLPDGAGGVRCKASGLPEEDFQLVSGDLNNDGRLDLLTSSLDSGRLQAWNYSLAGECFVELPMALPAVVLGYSGTLALVDFNNDGQLDLATFPYSFDETAPILLRIWLRQTDGSFADSGIRANLRQYPDQFPAMAWDDIDGDGWVDLALTANAQYYNDYYNEYYDSPCVVFLRNTQGTGLAEYGRGEKYDLPKGNMVFGDANNDGRPDLALSNSNLIYFNRGNGVFEKKDLNLKFFDATRVEWCDIDNDGWLDLLTTGDRGTVRDYYTNLYRNNGNETFDSAVGTLPGLWQGSLAPVDLDADGDMDLVAGGWIENVACWPVRERSLRIFRNRTAQAAGYGRANQPPQAPDNLQATVDGNRNLTLNWSPPQDDRTPAGALRYHVRIESFPGWNNWTSGAWGTDCAANRLTGQLGAQTGALAAGLPAEGVYCSVQAVDGSGARSAWSAPLAVRSGAAQDACDINRDGLVNAADWTTYRRLDAGLSAPAGTQADINRDGKVTPLDGQYVMNRLLGQDLPGREVVAMQTVGAAGGTILADGFELKIPAGQFAADTLLTLWRLETERPAGANSVSPTFRIQGIPAEGLTEFELRVRADRAFADAPFLTAGLDGWRTSGGEQARSHYHFKAAAVDGNWLTYKLAPPAKTTAMKTGAAPVTDAENATRGYSVELVDGWFGLTSGKAMVESDHFQLVYPVDHDFTAIMQLATALEDAYAKFKGDMGFTFNALPAGKIQAEALDRGPNEYGSFVNVPGTAYDKLEFNTKDVERDSAVVRQTAFHEFAHCVHAQFFSSVSNRYYWIDEASAVWAETIGNPAVAIPSPYNEDPGAAMKGMMANAAGNQEAHGYGMSVLMRYIEKKTPFPQRASALVWQYLKLGWAIPQGVRGALAAEDFKWYTDFLENQVEGKLFGYNFQDIDRDAPASRTYDLAKSDLDYSNRFSGVMPDLSGKLFQTLVNKNGLPADAVVSHRLAAPEYIDLTALQFIRPATTTNLGRGTSLNQITRLDIPIGAWPSDGTHRALTLLTNREGSAMTGYVGQTDYELKMAVTWNRSYPLPYAPAVMAGVYGGIPVFNTTGVLEGPGLTEVTMQSLTNFNGRGDSAGTLVLAQLMGNPPLTLTFDLDASITNGYARELIYQNEDHTEEYEYIVSEVTGYVMDYFIDEAHAEKLTMSSIDGRFTIPIVAGQTFFSGSVQVIYNVTINRLEDGVAVSTKVETGRYTNVGGLHLMF